MTVVRSHTKSAKPNVKLNKALSEWKPDQLFHKGKGDYDLLIVFGNINKGYLLTKKGKVVGEPKDGYATLNGVKQPLWKIMGYTTKIQFINAGIDNSAEQFVYHIKDTGKLQQIFRSKK